MAWGNRDCSELKHSEQPSHSLLQVYWTLIRNGGEYRNLHLSQGVQEILSVCMNLKGREKLQSISLWNLRVIPHRHRAKWLLSRLHFLEQKVSSPSTKTWLCHQICTALKRGIIYALEGPAAASMMNCYSSLGIPFGKKWCIVPVTHETSALNYFPTCRVSLTRSNVMFLYLFFFKYCLRCIEQFLFLVTYSVHKGI